MCANEYVYLGNLCAQMNHILSKCAEKYVYVNTEVAFKLIQVSDSL